MGPILGESKFCSKCMGQSWGISLFFNALFAFWFPVVGMVGVYIHIIRIPIIKGEMSLSYFQTFLCD